MKYRNFYIVYILASFLFNTSCNLDRNPLDNFAENEFWTSEENALIALTGIYRGNTLFNSEEYSPTDFWSYSGVLFLEFASDNAYDRRGNNSGFFQMVNGNFTANNGFISNYWSNAYAKISRCNRFLEGIDQIPASQETVNRFKSEARFIRAVQYFYLSQYFQDVPLVTSVLTKEEANNVKKASKQEIISFIEKEFKEAAEYLPAWKELQASEIGRASQQAAYAFLGRTYLAEKQYKEAANTFLQIINMGENKIEDNYNEVFYPAQKGSPEIIIGAQYLTDLAGCGLPQHAYPVKDLGWCIINPLGSLFEAYQFTDGSNFSYESPLYDKNNLGKNRDPRLDYTIYYDGATFKGTTYSSHPDRGGVDATQSGQTTQTGFMMRKYFDESYNGDLRRYGVNLPIIRYPEILLSYLEAKLEGGEPIDRSLLDLTINAVRGRSSVNMPPVTETNPDKLRPILRNERRVEFAMEGIRYWDLLRWGIAHEVLQGKIYGAPFPGRSKVDGDNNQDKYGRWYVNKWNFRQQDYKWPIPQSEQNINPNLR
ncbi:RagB/SusD family nutrient uptake outer membrane protein [Parabacteroides chongii]|uniref:RagB/SusD family nutrient uptake outer membrane protein n=1 Tax=Parabacteroides chongii TaxID=2685834 RepID=UPI00240D09D5|nr:RagB/SusD family nutrient uptake outer membrane protein [Parabacteroides chongii]WFE85525.1 RagB/SusD family nutrient uptake outer membrane protein [Parabacteroides chongii]